MAARSPGPPTTAGVPESTVEAHATSQGHGAPPLTFQPTGLSTLPAPTNLTDAAVSGGYGDPTDHNLGFHFLTPSHAWGPLGLFADDSQTYADSFGWIFEDGVDDVFPSMAPSPRLDLLGVNLESTIQSRDAEQPRNSVPADGQLSGAVSEELDDLPQPTPLDRCSPDDVWPMEWHAASNQRLTLPVLGLHPGDYDITLGSFYHLTHISEDARNRLLNSMRLPLERVPWQTVSLANFPSKEKLDHCLDMFFRHFDRVSLSFPG